MDDQWYGSYVSFESDLSAAFAFVADRGQFIRFLSAKFVPSERIQ